MVTRNAGNRAAAPSEAQTQSTPGAPPVRGFLTGAAARERSARVSGQQHQQVEQRAQGLDLSAINSGRFRLPNVGDEADIIVLDHNLDSVLFADEHQFKDANGRWNQFEFCPKEYDNCCLCEQHAGRPQDIGASSYTMFLTVLDLRGRNDERTGVFYPHVKRLMAVKTNLHPQFFKLHDACVREHGTMRGMQLLMARDETVNSSIGAPIMLQSGSMFEFVSEEALVQEFGHEEVRDPDRDNVLVKAANYDITPFAYTRVFTAPTGEDLHRKYGSGSGPAGSRSDVRQEWQGAEHRANTGQTRVRTRSQLGGSGSVPAEDEAEQPRQPQAIPARTRTRTAAPAGGPVQPGSPPARTRTRSAPQNGSGTAQRTRGVANDLDDVPI